MTTLEAIIVASFIESAISFSGVALLILGEARIRRFLHTILSFSVGALLGAVFLDILPEALEMGSPRIVLGFTLISIVVFFLLEKCLRWYHHHEDGATPHDHSPGYLVLMGDLMHNAIDGTAIAFSFMVDWKLGITTTIAVVIHEIPSEIGDFLVLLQSGFSKGKALLYNFLISLSTIVAALITYAFGSMLEPYLPIALALVAGNFLYIAIADIMPELQEVAGWKHTVFQTALLVLGIVLVGAGAWFK